MTANKDLILSSSCQDPKLPKSMRLSTKVVQMGASSVIITAVALVSIAVWQSGRYNQLAQHEVEILINADIDHITRSVYNLVRTEDEAAQLQVNGNLNVARRLLAGAGGVKQAQEVVSWTAINQFTRKSEAVELPRLLIGETWLKKNSDPLLETPIVDEVPRLVGETATIFQRMNAHGDMLRVATTVRTADNKRAIGTYIPAVNPDGNPNPVISAILKGDTYHGRAYVANEWHLTAYEPIKDNAGTLVGMLYVGIQQKAIESRLRNAVLQTQVGKTGYVYVMEGHGKNRGRYIISYKGERDGEYVWTSRDETGRYIIQDIIDRAITLAPGEMTTMRYRWRNPGEPLPRWKLARLAYYAPWDWVIGTSVYEDELRTYHSLLSDGRQRMTRVMAIAGIIITILVGLMGILITWTMTRPVRQITEVVEKIIDGDLNQVVEVESGNEIGVLARTFNMMTRQLKQSMESLKENEEKYRGIFENAIEGLFQSTLEGQFLSSNPAMAGILGYSSPEELMASVTDIGHQLYVDPARRDELVAVIAEHGKISGVEVLLHRKDKTRIWVSISGRLVYADNRQPGFLEGFITDINDRKLAEEALAESRDYLDEIINAVADPLFVKNRQHQWVLVNNAMCDFMGHSRNELLGKSDYDLLPKTEADGCWARDEHILTSGKENIKEELFTDAQGVIHTILARKTLHTNKKGENFIVSIIRDVTEQKQIEEERKQLETRLIQAQRMEAIGTLAGGIAHDFNNILSAIIGYTELAMEYMLMIDTTQKNKIQANLKQVLKAGDRAKELIRQILTFSRMTETEYAPISLRTVIKESLKMLRSVIPSTIEIRENLVVSGLVMSDPVQINQIILNLCTNAVHAMDETGGVLEVDLQEVIIDGIAISQGLDILPGTYLKLTIRDTGKGIPPEIMGRIFEPYFTTKKPESGTGLGLSVIHGIVKSHNGAITCQSTPDKETTFEVYLPKIKTESTRQDFAVEMPPATGHEHILFVDDEPILVELYVKMLSSRGYTVVPSTSGPEALELFRKDPQGFDLVITDMTMPTMAGDRLAQELIAIRHDIPVILCTGYNEHITEEKAKKIGIKEFILKPLNIKTLSETIRKVINVSKASNKSPATE